MSRIQGSSINGSIATCLYQLKHKQMLSRDDNLHQARHATAQKHDRTTDRRATSNRGLKNI